MTWNHPKGRSSHIFMSQSSHQVQPFCRRLHLIHQWSWTDCTRKHQRLNYMRTLGWKFRFLTFDQFNCNCRREPMVPNLHHNNGPKTQNKQYLTLLLHSHTPNCWFFTKFRIIILYFLHFEKNGTENLTFFQNSWNGFPHRPLSF